MTPPPFDRAGAKQAGYSDAEIDAFLASQAASDPYAISNIPRLASESSSVSRAPKSAPKAAESWSTRGKALSAARAGAQGLTFNMSDEAEALASSLVTKRPYAEELARIRGEMREFSEAYPKTAFVAEAAGGLATGGGMAAMAAKRGTALARALANSATAQGALSGAGSADGGVQNRLAGAGVGAVLGGAVGNIGGKAAGKMAERIARGGPIAPGTRVVMETMDAGRLTPDEVSARAAQMATDAPESRVLDVLGNPATRAARGIEALGGEAGETVRSTMARRLETRPERYQSALTRTTERGAENVLDTVEDIVTRRKEISDPLYEQLYQQPPIVDDEVERMLRNPGMRGPVQRAVDLLAIQERPVTMVELPDGTLQPARTPEFLDSVKKAMDDVIYRGKQPGEGGLGPSMLGALKKLRGEYVGTLDRRLPGYEAARNAWAGETALKNALEEGLEFATKRTDPRVIEKTLAEMSESEIEMAQRGWLDGIRQRIDNDALTPKQLRAPAFEKQATALFGADAEPLMRALSTELELNTNVGATIAGSRTVPAGVDVGKEIGQNIVSRALVKGGQFWRNPLLAGAEAADVVGARLGGQRAAAQRMEKAQALLTPASEIESVMAGVRRAAAARQLGQRVQRGTGTALGRLTGAGTVRGVSGAQERSP